MEFVVPMCVEELPHDRILMRVCLLFLFQYMTAAAAAAPMQGTYIPQYTPVPPTAVPVEVRPTCMRTLLVKY